MQDFTWKPQQKQTVWLLSLLVFVALTGLLLRATDFVSSSWWVVIKAYEKAIDQKLHALKAESSENSTNKKKPNILAHFGGLAEIRNRCFENRIKTATG